MAEYNHFLDPWKGPQNRPEWHSLQPPKKVDQKPVNIFSLFPNIDRWAIGYDTMFDMLEKMAVSKSAGFPPYNIVKDGDRYQIVMALAGYKRDQLSIKVEDRKLLVETVEKTDDDTSAATLLHQGIAQRNFQSSFALGEYVYVKSAKLEDGLLTIDLELELPDEKKPKQIEIK